MATAETLGSWEAPPSRAMEPPTALAPVPTPTTPPVSPGRLARRVAGLAVGGVATLLAVATVAVLLVVAIAPRMGWFQVETVLSGSMRPTFSPGDAILVTPEPASAVKTGQVITYAIPVGDHHIETHRIIRIIHGRADPVVVTKGDANSAPDPWRAKLEGTTAWRLWLVIPKLGFAIQWLRSPLVHLALVIIAPFLLAAWWLVGIWRTPTTHDEDA